MNPFNIKTPKGVVTTANGGKAILEYNPSFASKYNNNFFKKQRFVDSECVRLMESYTPLDTSMLAKVPLVQTDFGSGLVVQDTPYAKKQYYTNKGKGLRGSMWFERMKQNHKEDIRRGAEKI